MVIPQHILGFIDVPAVLPYVALACILGFTLAIVPILIWIERVAMALMQDRLGPNRVGPRGLLQTIADGVKLFFKEDIVPGAVDKRIYFLAPVLAMIPALAAGATIPFADMKVAMDADPTHPVALPLVVGNVNIGLLFVLALASLQVYGIVLAGWSSNNKYSLLGGLRSSAQIISYELSMSLAIMTAVLMAGSLNLVDIVHKQAGGIWHWNVLGFFPWGLLATIVYLISMIAETNRAPFDLPEAESELIAGFHTEYSSMKFAMFFMGEYASMLTVSAMATSLWFGGWQSPIDNVVFNTIPGVVWFLGKLFLFIFAYVWLRSTLPRLRYDALMNLGWKRLLPFALVILFAVAAVDTFYTPAAKAALAGQGGGGQRGSGGRSGPGGPPPVANPPLVDQPGDGAASGGAAPGGRRGGGFSGGGPAGSGGGAPGAGSGGPGGARSGGPGEGIQ